MSLTTADRLPPRWPAGRLRTTAAVLRNPRGLFNRAIERLGDPFTMTAINGAVTVTGRPELVEQIFKADPDTFAVFAGDGIRPILGAGSLLMMEGPPHRAERKRVAPPLHGGRMAAYGEAMARIARQVGDELADGKATTGVHLGTRISLDVILEIVLGADSTDLIQKFGESTRRVLDRSLPILFFSPRMQFAAGGWSPMDRLMAARQDLHQRLRAELSRRGDSIHDREDILSILAAQTDDPIGEDFQHLFESVGTLLFAGHETTAVSIAWCLYHLHRHPNWLAKVRAECDRLDGSAPEYANSPLLKNVVSETLRLNPIVTEVLRLLARPFQLGDYHLPAGHAVAAASCMTHYDPTIFPEPETFNPDRFADRTYTPSQYYPFGGGNRRCVGAAFASYELAIVLGTLIRHYDFDMLDRKVVRPLRRNVTMGPGTGIRIRIRPRQQSV